MRTPAILRRCAPLPIVLAVASCARTDLSSSLDQPILPTGDAAVTHVGGDGGASGPKSVTLSGTILDFDTKKPLLSAQVSIGGMFAMTDKNGQYSLTTQTDQAFSLSVMASGYLTYTDQPSQLSADATRETLVPNMQLTSDFWLTVHDYDSTLGIIGVQIIPLGSCQSIAGTKVKVTGEGAPVAIYYAGGKMSSSVHSAQDGESPTALVYNVPITHSMSVTANGGSCTPAPFPVTYQGVQWGNVVQAASGNAIVFVRLFVQ